MTYHLCKTPAHSSALPPSTNRNNQNNIQAMNSTRNTDGSLAHISGFIYTRSEYNAKGQLTKQYQDAGWNTPPTAATLFEYDTMGNVSKKTLALAEAPNETNSPTEVYAYGAEFPEDGIYSSLTRYKAEGNLPDIPHSVNGGKCGDETREIYLTSYAKCLKIILMSMSALKIGHHNKLFSILCLITLLNACVQCPSAPSDDSDRIHSSGENTLPPTLHPKAQRALDKVLAEGLAEYEVYGDRGHFENIEPFLKGATNETRYIMRILTNNQCDLGDGHSILRIIILPNLCSDLDELLKQETPSAQALDHAVWMASKLHLKNVISFLIHMGAPPNKYKLGD